MDKSSFRKVWTLLGIFFGVWLGLRYLFPIILPFLAGWAVAALAEPGIKFLCQRLKFRRGAASAVLVTAVLAGVCGLILLTAALVYREAVALLQGAPAVLEELSARTEALRDWAVEMAKRAPAGLSAILTQTVTGLFAGGSGLLNRAVDGVLGLAGKVVGGLTGNAMSLGTAVVASYLISAQMPTLGKRLGRSQSWQRLCRGWQRLKSAVSRWFRAQIRLSGVTFGVVLAGFLLLGVENGVILALVTAVVDAVPMLGTGILLLPWSVFSLLQGQTARSLGLLAVWATAMLLRSMLEPKLVGKQLGINPLVTLAALYTGFRIWGVAGMILAPILTVVAKELAAIRD